MTRPPRWIARMLEWALPPTERADAMIGDLEEEYRARHVDGRLAADLWYAREALGVAVRYARAGRRYHRRPIEQRAGRQGGWESSMDALWINVRYALRRLSRSPMFTMVAVVSLGLGIGANTAMFSLVNATIIREVPYEQPDELVDFYIASEGFSHGTLSYPDYVDLVDATLELFTEIGGAQLAFIQGDTDTGVEGLLAEAVTGSYFGVLGIRPTMGRLLGEQDDIERGAHPVVVLSHDYWQSRLGGDPDIVGTDLRLSGRPYTVVGVAPAEFTGTLRGLEPSVYVPIKMVDEIQGSSTNTMEARGNQSFFGRARLDDGATIEQARIVGDRLSATLREQHPQYWTADKAFVFESTADVIMNPMIDRFIRPAAGMVMVVVGMVLLIACANLASFLLARAADRRKEIAVRLAMGARRRTLVGQLLTETVLLSGIGGALGVWIAARSLDALVRADLPLPLPITLDLSLDGTVLTFSILLSIGAGVLFGLAPALQSTNPDVAPTLRDESAGGGRARGAALRNLLVVGQVSVSVVLLIAAGLFLRSLDASRQVDPGFGVGPTAIMHLTLPADRYSTEETYAFLDELGRRLRTLPGVEASGVIDNLHMNQLSTQNERVNVDGIDPPPGQDFHRIDYAVIDEHFLETLGIDVVAGRGISEIDLGDSEPVALVNEEFVRRFFPGSDGIGRSIRLDDEEHRVIGVTADHKVRRLGEDPRPFLYRPHRQARSNFFFVTARTSGDDEALALSMIQEARSLDPDVMIAQSMTLDRHLATMLVGRELGALFIGGFAALALLLASIGLYGVVSYAVARRTKEVGIRLSLGADSSSVVRMLTGSGMKLVGLGGVIGLVLAAALAQLLSRLLYGVPALDLVTFVTVPVVLGSVALLASWVPARRVTRIDPVGALRSE
ncbi:MAG: ADOP family duplicated permease [Gemmatimonadota bacterium]